jgi:L-fuculose-phosphate aldolase
MTMGYLQKYAAEVDQFLSVCGWLAQSLYVTSCGGNLAWKLEEDLLLITPTKMNKGLIRAADLVFIDLQGKTLEGTLRPTGETPMYLTFFKLRPDIVSVVHCHPPATCALAITKGKNWLMRPLFPETIIEVGPVPVVPYAEPITEKLAKNFEPFLPRYNSFIMENHGLVSITRGGIRETLMNVQILEMTAQILILALQAGRIKELDRQAVRDLSNTMRTRGLPLMGAPGVNPSLEALYFG